MGYEVKYHIIEKKTELKGIHGKYYSQDIAVFDLCKADNVTYKTKKYPITNSYIYDTDGNTELIYDEYGDELHEIPLLDMIQIIEDAMKDDEYRRFKPFLNLLKSFNNSDWHNVVILHYGY